MGFRRTIIDAKVVLTVQDDEGHLYDVEHLPPVCINGSGVEVGVSTPHLRDTWSELVSFGRLVGGKGERNSGRIVIPCTMVIDHHGTMWLERDL